MKNGRVWALIILVFLVGVFVLITHASLKSSLRQNEIAQSLPTMSQAISERETARVLRVIDGDTIEVSLNKKKEMVRLIGIDAPETLDRRKPKQCFGKEASSKAREVLTGKTIMLESDPTQRKRDEYGRLLHYVFLNNLNFNKFMISEGYAREYTFKNNVYKYQLEFIRAERKAKEENKGLWGSC